MGQVIVLFYSSSVGSDYLFVTLFILVLFIIQGIRTYVYTLLEKDRFSRER